MNSSECTVPDTSVDGIEPYADKEGTGTGVGLGQNRRSSVNLGVFSVVRTMHPAFGSGSLVNSHLGPLILT